MTKDEIIALVLRQIPDLDAVTAQLERDPRQPLRAARPPRQADEGAFGLETMTTDEGEKILRKGLKAAKKVRDQGADAKLTKDDSLGLEAVILAVGRPAILVQDNSFPEPPPGWEALEQNRAAIEEILPSVGRIDIIVNKERFQLGTGFLVGKNIVMTNRHVAMSFAKKEKKAWALWETRKASIDWYREDERPKSAEFRVKRVIGIHEHKDIDLALLEIEPKPVKGKLVLPDVLRVSAKASKKKEQVYAVGYPKVDNSGDTPAAVLQNIFGGKFGVKRLQPGENDGAINPRIFSHDCSTLGGNSGSCVVSLETHKVIGLHFRGTYTIRNEAVALWKLKDDPLIKGKIAFD